MIRVVKSKKIVLTLVLVLALVLGLAACGNKEGSSGGSSSGGEAANSSGKSMEEVLLAAAKNASEAESMTYNIKMDMGMSLFGMNMDSMMDMNAETIQSPIAMHMTGTTDMGEMGSYEMEIYAEEEGGKLTMYSGTTYGEDEMWIKTAVDMDSSELSQYNAQSNIKLYMENASNFKEVGTEDIDGVKAVRFDGIVTGESIGKVIKESGMSSYVAGVDEETLKALYTDLGDMPISFWVDTEAEMVVKYEIDMSTIMKDLIDKTVAEEAGSETITTEDGESMDLSSMFSISRSIITVQITGINNVDPILIPAEVKEAAEEMALEG